MKEQKGASFSDDKKYRYTLVRRWGDGPMLMFLMLNPSTADADTNDPTVERCQRRARDGNYGGLFVGNLFAYRSTDPRTMLMVRDPIGPDNDAAIMGMAHQSETIVCGWGNYGSHLGRGSEVLKMLRNEGITPMALSITKQRQPGHPLYIGYENKPFAFRG